MLLLLYSANVNDKIWASSIFAAPLTRGVSGGEEVVVFPPLFHPHLRHGRLRGLRHEGLQVHLLSRERGGRVLGPETDPGPQGGDLQHACQRYLRRGQELGRGADLRPDQGGQDPGLLCVRLVSRQSPRLLQRRFSVSWSGYDMRSEESLLLQGRSGALHSLQREHQPAGRPGI